MMNFKKFLFFFVMISTVLWFALSKPHAFLTYNSQPTTLLKEVFDVMNLMPAEQTLAGYHAMSQEHFLRPTGKERWEMPHRFAEYRERLLPIFHQADWIQEWKVTKKSYKYAVVLGGTVPRMRSRMEYLIALMQQGIRFENIYIVTGDRALDLRVDQDPLFSGLKKQAANESQAAKILWEGLKQKLNVTQKENYIATPMISEKGALQRPNTYDTLVNLFECIGKEPGDMLFFSSQPYCAYQHQAILNVIPKQSIWKRCVIETVGRVNQEMHIDIFLDTLARYLDMALKGTK